VSSSFARYVAQLISELPRVTLLQDELSRFARAVDYHVKFLPQSCLEDFASLISVECLEAANTKEPQQPVTLDLDALKSILSRVQKRVYREITKHKLDKLTDVAENDLRTEVSPQTLQEVLEILEAYITTEVSPRDGHIFSLRYIQNQSADEIASQLRMGKSIIYRRLAKIERVARRFLKELDIPQ
jgi:hypothetical protein